MIARSIPLSARELCAAVRAAQPCDVSRLDRILRVDEDHGLVEVQAATPWKAIAAGLRPDDARAAGLETTMPTVGESLSCNAAGPDGRPAVTHVDSMTVVTPGGELRRLSRNASPELFALVAGGQGLFGTLYSVTLQIGSLSTAVNQAAEPEILSTGHTGTAPRALRVLVPPAQLDAFLGAARARCDEWRMPLAGVKVRRTREERDTFLRWARRDYADVTLELAEPPVLGVAVRATQLRRALLDAAIRRGGSFPVYCTPEATREQAEACYPELPRFLEEKRRLDPAEKIVNSWYRHFRRLFGRQKCEVRWAREPG